MIACPKCEARLHRDAVFCPLCGTALALRGFMPDKEKKAEPVLDPLLSYFERDESVSACPQCWNEFHESSKTCRLCRKPLVRHRRSQFEAALLAEPIQDLGREVSRGPSPLPRDLVRVRIAEELAIAIVCAAELRFVGLEAWLGSDSLDPFEMPGAVGVYVRRPDGEAARYVVDGLTAKDPLLEPEIRRSDPKDLVLEVAAGYAKIGKFKEALRRLAAWPDDPNAAILSARCLLRSGQIREAEKRALSAAMKLSASSADKGRLLAEAALPCCLGRDGTAFGAGSDLRIAVERLREAAALAPRDFELSKMHLEVLAATGNSDALTVEIVRVERLTPNLFAHNGPFRQRRDALRLR